MTKLFSTKEAAEMLNVSEWTLRKWFREGRVEGIPVGKSWAITEENLQKALESMPVSISRDQLKAIKTIMAKRSEIEKAFPELSNSLKTLERIDRNENPRPLYH